ncbi:uncharacterized protein LOC143842236 [Paroedura picta]|uniref:uncharacterized protein LOC143842236 n=1 Tax=Paroedura picta TaxID=143630 RepID=UPI0040568B49
MRPSKRTNTNSNLIVCGAPAKKVPKAPVPKQDSSKPALWKAFEAVVAAGRRGLLGPAAMAAVEAMPDSELGCCDGEIAQETPSSAPLVEEKKTENKECNAAVMVTRPGNGTGSGQLTRKEIWICGDSVISLSRMRVQFSRHGPSLGFPPSAASVYWQDVPTMMWDDLLPALHHIYHIRDFPSIIVIHGEHDLLSDRSFSLATRIQSDLAFLQRALPDVVIIWSSLLPKHAWLPDNSKDVESERNKINCKMEEYCNETGIYYLTHPLITGENKSLFLPSNTLSHAGADVFITDLIQVLNVVHNKT